MPWTLFWDMHSGGGTKEPPYQKIYIEAPIEEAKVVFYNRFGHNPDRVTCTCCGEDYSIDEEPTLAKASGFHRGAKTLKTPRKADGSYDNDLHRRDPWFDEHYYIEPEDEAEAIKRGYEIEEGFASLSRSYMTVEEYIAQDEVLVIYDHEIAPDERKGTVPEQGYVWAG